MIHYRSEECKEDTNCHLLIPSVQRPTVISLATTLICCFRIHQYLILFFFPPIHASPHLLRLFFVCCKFMKSASKCCLRTRLCEMHKLANARGVLLRRECLAFVALVAFVVAPAEAYSGIFVPVVSIFPTCLCKCTRKHTPPEHNTHLHIQLLRARCRALSELRGLFQAVI